MQAAKASHKQQVRNALLARVSVDALCLPGNALVREELQVVQRALAEAVSAVAQLQEVQVAVARAERDRADIGRTDSLMGLVNTTEELQQELMNAVKRFAAPQARESAAPSDSPATPEIKAKNLHEAPLVAAEPTEQRHLKRHRGLPCATFPHPPPASPLNPTGSQREPYPRHPSPQSGNASTGSLIHEVIDLLSDEENEEMPFVQEDKQRPIPSEEVPSPAAPVQIPVVDEAAAIDDPFFKKVISSSKLAVTSAKRVQEMATGVVSLELDTFIFNVLTAMHSLENLGRSKYLTAMPTKVLGDIAWSMSTVISTIVGLVTTPHVEIHYDLSYLLIELSYVFKACQSPEIEAPFLQVQKRLEGIQREGKIRVWPEETIQNMWTRTTTKSMAIARELEALSAEEKPKRFEELLKRLSSLFLMVLRRGRSVIRYLTSTELECVKVAVEVAVAGITEQWIPQTQQTNMLIERMQLVAPRFSRLRPILTKPLALHVESEKAKRSSVSMLEPLINSDGVTQQALAELDAALEE